MGERLLREPNPPAAQSTTFKESPGIAWEKWENKKPLVRGFPVVRLSASGENCDADRLE